MIHAMTFPLSQTRLLQNAPTLFAAYPLAWLALVYLFAARARFQLGHWPAPYRSDPLDLGFGIHHSSILLGMVAMPAVVVSTLALAVIRRQPLSRRRHVATLGLLVVSNVILGTLCQWDPGHVFEWFAD